TIYTFEEKVLKQRELQQQAHTRNQIAEIQSSGEWKRRLKMTGYFVVGFAVLAFIASLLMGAFTNLLVSRIPAKWESQFGETLMEEIRKEEHFSEDAVQQKRLDGAVAPLLVALPRDGGVTYQFYLLEERLPNAFALPGGYVMVTTGLMELVEGEPEELAAVVAHEIAHVTQKHGFRKIISAAGPYLIMRMVVRDESGLLGVLGQGSEVLVRQSFSQEYELEADAVGWDYLLKAKIDPRAMPRVLTKLQEVQDRMGQQPGLAAFSSHPETEKRIKRLEKKWQQLKVKPEFVQIRPE
ncbi:MAG TPA: M48 family metallopeptidase, partial [Clostridia bacterium]|nr:M48 family metallopeptidase [Clostridia bacterium]